MTNHNTTYQFAYDNGLGSSADRFKIDLYYADIGHGDCGKWLTSICDKPEIGCKDSSETGLDAASIHFMPLLGY